MSNQTGAFPARILDKRATDDATPIEAGDAFGFLAEISSDRLDAYFTHMAESTLRNFAKDADSGVALLDSHNNRNLGFGRSIGGVFQVEDGVSRVVGDFFTVAGIRFGSSLTYESTDDFIRAIKAGLVRDMSVGFYGGDMICDICGNSFSDWMNCSHWPGEEYAIGDKGEKTVIAAFAVEDAHLAEVSVVYDGATPGAMIMRATEMAEAGKLSPEMTRRLEVKYRIKLPGAARSWSGVDTKGTLPREKPGAGDKGGEVPKGKEIMTEPIKTESDGQLAGVLTELRAILTEAKFPENAEVTDGVRWLADRLQHSEDDVTRLTAEVTRLQPMESEVQRLQPLADDGTQYRADLIDTAIVQGIQAMGDKFPQETYREMLKTTPLDQIKRLLESWGGKPHEVFTTGGRQWNDQDEEQTPQKPERETPNLAYAG